MVLWLIRQEHFVIFNGHLFNGWVDACMGEWVDACVGGRMGLSYFLKSAYCFDELFFELLKA